MHDAKWCVVHGIISRLIRSDVFLFVAGGGGRLLLALTGACAPTHLAGHLHEENQIFGTARGPAGIALLVGKLKLKV